MVAAACMGVRGGCERGSSQKGSIALMTVLRAVCGMFLINKLPKMGKSTGTWVHGVNGEIDRTCSMSDLSYV